MIGEPLAHEAVGRNAQPVELEAGGVQDVVTVREAHLRRHRPDSRVGTPSSSITATASGSTVVSLLNTAILSPRDRDAARDTAGEALVAIEGHQLHVGEVLAHELHGAVTGAVVDHDQLGVLLDGVQRRLE